MLQARPRLLVAFATVYLLWGSTYLAIRYAIATIPPFFMAGTRFLVAGVIVYAWTMSRGEKRPTSLQFRNAAIVGLLLLGVGNGGVVWAEQTVPSGIAALIVAIVPLWLVILAWARPGGKRPTAGVGAGVAVGLIGMLVLVGPDSLRGSGPINIGGVLVLLVASFSWSGGTLFAKTADLPSPMMTTAIEMLVAGVALMLAGAATGEATHFAIRAVSSSSLIGIGYLIVFGSIIAFTAYSWLVKNATPAAVGTYAYVNPVVAVFLGWLIAGEPVSARTLIGAAIIVLAVIVVSVSTSMNGTQNAAPRKVRPGARAIADR